MTDHAKPLRKRPRRSRITTIPDEEILAEINITPLTDVLLVLLIIFLVAAAAGVFGFNMRLPKGNPKAFTQSRFKGVMITLPSWAKEKQAVFVGTHLIHLDILPNVLRQEKLKKKTAEVVLRIDRIVPYGIVITVMDSAKMAGLDDISFAAPVVEK